MDHIPKIQKPAFAFPSVRYYGNTTLVYSGPFETFRDRRPNHSGNENNQRNELSHFLREYLFFGLLQEMVTLYELPFDRADFIKKGNRYPVISTAKVHDYFVALIV